MNNKIKGLLWGGILGDTLAAPYKGDKLTGQEYTIKPQDIIFKDKENNIWTSVTDQVVILIEALKNARPLGNILNCFSFANSLKNWQEKGIVEVPPKEKHIGMQLNFTLKQEGYLQNPIKSCKKSYILMGGDSGINEALARNAICGIMRDWYKNTMLQTIITNYDSRCIVASIVQSYIINCITYKKKIKWSYINAICQKIIVTQKIKKSNNLMEFNNHWHIALNYKNIASQHEKIKKENIEENIEEKQKENIEEKESCFLTFIKKLNIGNYQMEENQSYVLLGMVLSVITIIDIQNELSNDRTISVCYFTQKIQEIISVGGDTTSNASIVGSIVGLYIGYDALPKDWIKAIAYKDWLNIQIDKFLN